MGGFKPSRSDIAGSTIVGSDKDVDVHQFTGSVDITGSLTLNGASITSGGGGGGGVVSSYTNAGDDRVLTSVNSNTINGEANLTFDGTSLTSPQVTASVSMKTPALEISSSEEGALLRIDHSTHTGSSTPIFYVTGSGLVGIGTDSPRADTDDPTTRLHILGEGGADQGTDPVINTVLMLENDNHVGIQFMFPTSRAGQLTWGTPGVARRATYYYDSNYNRFNWEGLTYGGSKIMDLSVGGDCLNIGSSNADHLKGAGQSLANLHISSSTEAPGTAGGGCMLRIDHGNLDLPVLFVTGSGRLGVSTNDPGYALDISGATAQGSVGPALMGYNGSRADAANFAHVSHMSDSAYALQQRSDGETILNAPNGQNVSMRINGTNALVVNGALSANVGINTSEPAARLHVSASSVENDVLRIDGVGTKENALYVSGSGVVGIGTSEPHKLLHLKSATSASIWIEADTDNTPETDTGYLKITQDGNGTRMIAGLNGNAGADPEGVYLENAIANACIMGPRTAGSPLQLVTNNRVKIIATNDGQVGIGESFKTSNEPTAILHISGTEAAQGTAHSSPLMKVDHDANANILFVTGSGRVGIGTASPSQALDVAGTANATTLSIGGTSITSTAAELNLLDASNGSPSAGAWAAVERVGVYTFSGAKAGSALAGGGTDHVLGTLPAGAYVTEAYLDITSVFAVADVNVAISLGTATTYPTATRPFLEVCPPSSIPRTGGTVDATAAPGLGVLTLSAGSGFSPALFPGAKLPAQENVVLNVADGGGGTNGVTASGATLILKYIVM